LGAGRGGRVFVEKRVEGKEGLGVERRAIAHDL
jgi:hypothetical protein